MLKQTDSFIIVVSEETGAISYVYNGKIKHKSKEYSSKEIIPKYSESLSNIKGLGVKRGE